MTIEEFPPLDTADEDGLIALGGDLEPESILLAYRSGIFPWPINDGILAWFSPPKRGVIFLKDLHISRSLKRELKKTRFTTRIDTAFKEVITRCAELKNRGDQDGTWITAQIIDAYTRLHEMGFAHSFETYLDGELVGGLYGIKLDSYFVAESSFYRKPNASKLAMLTLVEYLKKHEISWFDCQMITSFSKGFGAVEIDRREFWEMVKGGGGK